MDASGAVRHEAMKVSDFPGRPAAGGGDFLYERLAEEVARASRHGLPLACVVFRVSEVGTAGLGADAGLVHAATVLARRVVRVSDVVAPFGQGQFAVVANTASEGAGVLASSVVAEVQALEFVQEGRHVRVSVTYGTACLSGEQRPHELLEEARAALELQAAAHQIQGQS